MIDGDDGLDSGRARGGFHRNEAISASSMGRTTTSTATPTSATGSTRPSTVATRRGVFRPGTNGGEKTNHRSRASGCLPWRFSSRWQRRRRWSRSRGSPKIRDSEKASSRCSERDRPIPVAEGAARTGLGQVPGSIDQIQSHNGNNGFSNECLQRQGGGIGNEGFQKQGGGGGKVVAAGNANGGADTGGNGEAG
ncbi:hypothetical protein MUK42_01241 [Musa troglodytarum]|uniref:Uncharacterized protein n=1 Tax=Musa troglodytarum TaxID=320322 RepID=A0A9E7JU37_9LILI|nr:hypothetical protein MUK42_01241 [Musa troglodytarum]